MDTREFYNNAEDADIKIIIGDKIIHAHKVFLKHASAMFKGGLSHAMKEHNSGVFEFIGRDPAAVEIAIKWMYGIKDDMKSATASTYFESLSIANYLCMDKFTSELITGFIPEDASVIDIIHCAHLYSSVALMTRAVHRCNGRLDDWSDREAMGKELTELSLDKYEEFRKAWIRSNHPFITIFMFDCYYAEASGDNIHESIDVLNRFIHTIPFEKFDVASLSSAFDFPLVRDFTMLTHMLLCLQRVRQGEKSTNSRIATEIIPLRFVPRTPEPRGNDATVIYMG